MPDSERDRFLPPSQGMSGCLVRLCWMGYGILLVVLSIVFNVTATCVLSWTDVLYWCSVTLIVGLSYLDVARLNQCFDGSQPQRIRRWRRLMLWAVLAFAAIWAVSDLIVYLRLGPQHIFQ